MKKVFENKKPSRRPSPHCLGLQNRPGEQGRGGLQEDRNASLGERVVGHYEDFFVPPVLMPLIPALERQRQGDLREFQASLVYLGSSKLAPSRKKEEPNMFKAENTGDDHLLSHIQ